MGQLRYAVAGLCLMGPLSALAAEDSASTSAPVIDRAAERLMVDFCGLLKAANRFSFHLESSYDEVLKTGMKVQYHKSSEFVVERPSRLRVDAESDKGERSYVYDGKSVTVYDPERALYAAFPAPATLDAMLDAAEAQGIVIPLDDLAHSRPCAGLAENVREGLYAGRHYWDGEPHHHLVFTTGGAEIQLWLDVGEIPLLRRVVIDYRTKPGVPRYEGVLTDWNFDPAVDARTFKFMPPEGAKRIEFRTATAGSNAP